MGIFNILNYKGISQNESLRLTAQPPVAAVSYEAEKDIHQKSFPDNSGKEARVSINFPFHYCM